MVISIEDVKDIEKVFTDGGVVFTEQLSQVQQQRNLYSAFAVLVYGFLSIIVAITIPSHYEGQLAWALSQKRNNMRQYAGQSA